MKLSALAPVFLFSLGTLTACGGSDSTEPTPTPKDTTAPVITLIGNTPLTHSIDTSYDDEGATANDATDGNVDVTMTGSVDSTIVNSYTLTYTATDTAGNKSTSTRIVNVIDDVAPVITLGGSSEVIHPVGTPYIDASATASDNVDEVINVITSDDVKADAIGSYTVTYNATDAADNAAITVMRTVNVVDLTAPVITLTGEAIIEHNYGDDYDDAGATATDNIDTSVTVTTTGGVNIDQINSYTITYTAEDAAGNEATAVVRTVNVSDLVGPVITLNGDSTITLGQGRDYKELGATALDVYDNEVIVIAGPIEPVGTVDNTTIAEYQLTYTATDAAGNISTLVRIVDVVEPRPFITTWQTTAAGESIAIGTDPNTYTYNFDVDWGDGTPVENYQAVYFASHTYINPGTYTVTINGALPRILMNLKGFDNNNLKLININQWGDIAWENMSYAFYQCVNATSDAIDTPDLRLVNNMKRMFEEAVNFNADISHWDVSSVMDLDKMFNGASAFNQDLSLWDISSVDDMIEMFWGSNMSTVNNDALLQTWSLQVIQHDVHDVRLGLSSKGYSTSSDAVVENLSINYNWTISSQ
ncbi:MAG: DUF5011 domain-containing protein [Colwellia sp.]|uniref:immunoglobulin-like domain-containing protein n=2 Tax=Alteromonadales TaxID=135622 RepID=UPI0025BB8C1C|nr:immunoglobulin-like domain-containing protein [Colwellia sp.]NQZ27494.1 DUF5011 domain-containing protein [Colwellia sp.]